MDEGVRGCPSSASVFADSPSGIILVVLAIGIRYNCQVSTTCPSSETAPTEDCSLTRLDATAPLQVGRGLRKARGGLGLPLLDEVDGPRALEAGLEKFGEKQDGGEQEDGMHAQVPMVGGSHASVRRAE